MNRINKITVDGVDIEMHVVVKEVYRDDKLKAEGNKKLNIEIQLQPLNGNLTDNIIRTVDAMVRDILMKQGYKI